MKNIVAVDFFGIGQKKISESFFMNEIFPQIKKKNSDM
jgi:hypothetical protein